MIRVLIVEDQRMAREDMENYIKAGCSRLGTSSAVDILG